MPLHFRPRGALLKLFSTPRPLVAFVAFFLVIASARSDDATTFAGQALYVGDYSGTRILRLTPDAQSTVYANLTFAPGQFLFDEAGNLFVAGGSGIYKIAQHAADKPATLENGLVTVITDKLSRAKALARDRAGNFWVTEFYQNVPEGAEVPLKPNGQEDLPPGTLKKVTPDGQITVIEKDLVFGYGLAAGPDGSMYLAHLGGQRVVRYLPDGTQQVVGKHFWPRNLLFEPDGDLLVMGGKEIGRFKPDGTKEVVHDMKADEFGSTHSIGLALDAHGVLYSSDWIKRKGAKNEGLIYRYENGKRTIFARVGQSPSWLAFWPPSPAASASK